MSSRCRVGWAGVWVGGWGWGARWDGVPAWACYGRTQHCLPIAAGIHARHRLQAAGRSLSTNTWYAKAWCVQVWEVKSNDVDIAVTPSSNKAFIHWHVRGVQKETQQVRRRVGRSGRLAIRQAGLSISLHGAISAIDPQRTHLPAAGTAAMRLPAAWTPLLSPVFILPVPVPLDAAGERHVRAQPAGVRPEGDAHHG